MQEHGDTVAGKKIELIVKDDAGVPDNAKRLAQELVVNDKAAVLMGMGLTPIALAVAPIATAGQGARGRHSRRRPRSSPKSRLISCARASRCRSRRPSSPTGRRRTASRRWSRSSPTMPPGRMPRRPSSTASRLPAARPSSPSACPAEPGLRAVPAAGGRCQARCAVHFRAGQPGRRSHEAVQRARPRQVRHQAHRAPAISPTTMSSTRWATPPSAP